MGAVNWLAVVLGALAFLAVGALWYGPLFGKAWRREVRMSASVVRQQRGNSPRLIRLLAASFLLELVIAWMLGHLIARTSPAPHVIMMFALGFGAFLMSPALGINYLYQSRSLKLWLIDSGHFIVGMAAMGGVFVALT